MINTPYIYWTGQLPGPWGSVVPSPRDPRYIFPVAPVGLRIDGGSVSTASGGAMTALDNLVGGAHTNNEETWYRVKVRFPSGEYVPTHGEWNIHVEWHSRYSQPGPFNSFYGVRCDFSQSGLPGVNPRLFFCLRGGKIVGNATTEQIYIDPLADIEPLKFDHWYDECFRFVWKTEHGAFEWWHEGRQVYANGDFPTRTTFPDGTADTPGFGLYNYRRNDISAESRVDFALVALGPTKISVGL